MEENIVQPTMSVSKKILYTILGAIIPIIGLAGSGFCVFLATNFFTEQQNLIFRPIINTISIFSLKGYSIFIIGFLFLVFIFILWSNISRKYVALFFFVSFFLSLAFGIYIFTNTLGTDTVGPLFPWQTREPVVIPCIVDTDNDPLNGCQR